MTGVTFPSASHSPSNLQRLVQWLKRWFSVKTSAKQVEEEETTRFVVLAHQRTGSNWLCGILYQHPEIEMHNELFNEMAPKTYNVDSLKGWNFFGDRDSRPAQFLHFIWNSSKKKAVGFKSFPEHWYGERELYT